MIKINNPSLKVFILSLGFVLLSACTSQGQKQPASIDGYSRIAYPGELMLFYTGILPEEGQPFKVLANNKLFHVFGKAVKPSVQGLYLLENSVINEGELVLDIGTGAGIQAIFAAEKAHHIVATDIGEDAVKSTRVNVKRFGLEDKIDVRLGSLFEPVKEGEKFDVIIYNINYPEKDDNESDPLWQIHEEFFRDVKKYLKPDGRIIYQSGYIFNIPRINKMARENGLQIMKMNLITSVMFYRELVVYIIKRKEY